MSACEMIHTVKHSASQLNTLIFKGNMSIYKGFGKARLVFSKHLCMSFLKPGTAHLYSNVHKDINFIFGNNNYLRKVWQVL